MYHKLIITLLLFCSISFGQSGKSVLTQAQKDSIGAMIRDSSGYITPEKYGAVGDGVTSDNDAFTALFSDIDSVSIIRFNSSKQYNTTGDFVIKNIHNVIIDMNGAKWDLNGGSLKIWGQGTDSPSINDYTILPISSWFDGDAAKDSFRIAITDSNDWKPIYEWDQVMLRDSTHYVQEHNGVMNYFERFEVEGGQQYIRFKYPFYWGASTSNIGLAYKVNSGNKKLTIKNANLYNSDLIIYGVGSVSLIDSRIHRELPEAYYVYPLTSETLNYAFSTEYCRTVFIDNYEVSNYIKDGGGYGFSFIRGGWAFVNNMKAHNCRHAITTGAMGYGYGVYISNSEASYSETWANRYNPYDTHEFNLEWKVNNVIVRNALYAFYLRGHSLNASNITLYDTRGLVAVIPNQSSNNDTSKRYIRLDGFNVNNDAQLFSSLVYLDDDVRVDNIDIKNGEIYVKKHGGNRIFLAGVSSAVDSMSIDNVKMLSMDNDSTGRNGDRLFDFTNIDTIKYLSINNFKANKFQYGIKANTPKQIPEVYITNSEFEKIYSFLYCSVASDTSDIDSKIFYSKNNKYSIIKYWFNNNLTLQYWDKITSINDEFNFIGRMFYVNYWKAGQLNFFDSKFNMAGYNEGYVIGLDDLSSTDVNIVNTYTFKNDTDSLNSLIDLYNQSASYDWVFSSETGGLGLLSLPNNSVNTPSINIIGNKFFGKGSQYILNIARPSYAFISQNIFNPDSTSNSLIYLYDVNGRVLSNNFICEPISTSTTWYGIYAGGVSNLVVDNNYVEGTVFGESYGIYFNDNKLSNQRFSFDVNSWAGYSSTIKYYSSDYNSVGRTNILLDSATATSTVAPYQLIDVVIGEVYILYYDYYIPSTNTTTVKLTPRFGAGDLFDTQAVTDAWTSVVDTVTVTSNKGDLRFLQADVTPSYANVTVGDKIYIDNVKLIKTTSKTSIDLGRNSGKNWDSFYYKAFDDTDTLQFTN